MAEALNQNLRTTVPDFDTRRRPKTSFYCCVCQKDMDEKTVKLGVHMIEGLMTILHPADENKYVSGPGDLGLQPIGTDCARKLGLEWTHAWPHRDLAALKAKGT